MTPEQDMAQSLNKLAGPNTFAVEGSISRQGRRVFTVCVVDNREEQVVLSKLRWAQRISSMCGFSTRLSRNGALSVLKLTGNVVPECV